MNSRAWTEPATGAEAKSVRRWARRAVAPLVLRYLILLMLVVVGFHVYVNLSAALLENPVCLGLCTERPTQDLDWDSGDLVPF